MLTGSWVVVAQLGAIVTCRPSAMDLRPFISSGQGMRMETAVARVSVS